MTLLHSVSYIFCEQLLMLFHLKYMRLSYGVSLLLHLSLVPLTSIIRWLTYCGATHKHGEPCYNFSISNDPLTDSWLSYLDPWLWFSQSCSLDYLNLCLCCSSFPFIGIFWSCCLISHWLSLKPKGVLLFIAQIFIVVGSTSSWLSKRSFMGGYL